ncbi:MAG: hypothetical protein A2V63_05595 [Candidatus Eisenbacteria bacterium RBG_19FT_COMBO_70_11]|nr:MAG: hypothetical protein A2V63_05595 [Candidatus Eisenbacteria bacterium RBG_19FT_COMBO_70_11]
MPRSEPESNVNAPESSALFPQTAARLAEWRADPDVLGALLVGSKTRGHQDALSDDDLEVILTDRAFARIAPADCHALLIEGEGPVRRIIYDAQLTSLADIGRKARSPFDLDHWPYEKARVLLDRDGRVGRAVEAAARMAPEFRRLRLLHATIDAAGAAGRAGKTLRRNFEAAAHLLVARGALALARILFALEGRWVPLDHWIEPELDTLADEARVAPLLLQALATLRPEPIREALDRLEDRLAAEGVPRPAERVRLFLELVHVSRVAERAEHGLW